MFPQQQANNKYKTQLCRHFSLNGVCALGMKCQFAHGQHELRQQNEPMPTNNMQFQKQPQMPGVNPMIANYKSKIFIFLLYFIQKLLALICKHFNPVTGQCKNGPNCTFAHGEHELNNNNYLQNTYMQQFANNQSQFQMQKQQQSQQQLTAELTQQILVIILTHMETIFPGRKDIIEQLKKGQELASSGQTQEASDIIKQVIHDPQRTKEEKQQYQQIYNNAQKHYENKMKELTQQQYTQQY